MSTTKTAATEPMKLVIAPDFRRLESFLRTLPSCFESLGDVVQDRRNLIRRIPWEDLELNVKRFRIPNWLNQRVYGVLRPTKAERSYRHARELVRRGFHTPEAIATLEQRRGGRLGYSYFICRQVNGLEEIRAYLDLVPDRIPLLQAFARYTAALHDAGILHLDYSPGNILFEPDGETYRFWLVDLNRMRFGPVTQRDGCRSFRRLFRREESLASVVRDYAAARGFDPDACVAAARRDNARFWRHVARKARIRKRLGW